MKYNTLIIIFFINNLFFLANISFLLTFEAMNWDNIIGQDALKKQLQESVKNNRIGQALLFVGQEGYGILPLILAFCREIISMENPESAIKIDSLNHIDMHFSFPTYKIDKKNISSSSHSYIGISQISRKQDMHADLHNQSHSITLRDKIWRICCRSLTDRSAHPWNKEAPLHGSP